MNQIVKLVFEIGVILLFFILYQTLGLYWAIAGLIAAYGLKILWQLFRHYPVEKIQWISFIILLVFGGSTLIVRNELFFKWKPTVIYWVFAAVLAFTMLFTQISLLEKLSGHVLSLPKTVWRQLDKAWFWFFGLMGMLNLLVAYNYSTEIWIYFKLFGMLAALVLFIGGQLFFLRAYLFTQNTHDKTGMPHE